MEPAHLINLTHSSHCFLRQNWSSEKEIYFFNNNCDPSIYTMDHPDAAVRIFMENSTGLKWVKNWKLSLPLFMQ